MTAASERTHRIELFQRAKLHSLWRHEAVSSVNVDLAVPHTFNAPNAVEITPQQGCLHSVSPRFTATYPLTYKISLSYIPTAEDAAPVEGIAQ